jgi:ketosteroid isomerase-like protein
MMGATENAALVRRAYEAFNTADMGTLNETFAESAVWHAPGHAFGKDYMSREATFAYFGQLGEGTKGTFRANLHHMLAGEDGYVVGLQRSTGDRDGKHLDVGNAIVFRVEDGLITEAWEHFDDLYTWDEFWS